MFKLITAILMLIASAVLGLYVGGYLMLFGGLVQIFLNINPIDGLEIAIGITKVFFAGVFGWSCFFALFLPGYAILGTVK